MVKRSLPLRFLWLWVCLFAPAITANRFTGRGSNRSDNQFRTAVFERVICIFCFFGNIFIILRGNGVMNAAQLAVEEINAAGGVNGMTLKFMFFTILQPETTAIVHPVSVFSTIFFKHKKTANLYPYFFCQKKDFFVCSLSRNIHFCNIGR